MCNYGFLQVPIGPLRPYGSLWVFKGLYASSWIPMGPYGSL